MPKFYFERIVHRYVYEYYEAEADDSEDAYEMYDEGEAKLIGSVVGGRIKHLDDGDEMIAAGQLPKRFDIVEG